jgi:hypothetical protein
MLHIREPSVFSADICTVPEIRLMAGTVMKKYNFYVIQPKKNQLLSGSYTSNSDYTT